MHLSPKVHSSLQNIPVEWLETFTRVKVPFGVTFLYNRLQACYLDMPYSHCLPFYHSSRSFFAVEHFCIIFSLIFFTILVTFEGRTTKCTPESKQLQVQCVEVYFPSYELKN